MWAAERRTWQLGAGGNVAHGTVAAPPPVYHTEVLARSRHRMGLETATTPVQTRRMMQDPEPKRLQHSVIQIVAGTFATVSAAALGSTLGVEGTLLGAAVSSVVATVAAALYTHSLEQARRRIRWRRNRRTGTVEPVAH